MRALCTGLAPHEGTRIARGRPMLWSVGAVDSAVTYSTAVDGRLFVDGISVAGRGGWIHVRRPASGPESGELATVSVRVRIRRAMDGNATLVADEILSTGQCDEVEAAREAWNGSDLARRFARAVLVEFESRITRARSLAAGRTASDSTDRHDSVCDD